MTTTPTDTSSDVSAVQHLSRRFATVFENPDSADDVLSADVFFDLNMPV